MFLDWWPFWRIKGKLCVAVKPHKVFVGEKSADESDNIEGLLLLGVLTASSPDLQKLVAFESAFDRIFGIINAEGSLTHGGAVVQDCLCLLANLLRLNVSNQSYFRETGWFKKLATLLREVLIEQDSADGVAEWAVDQRDKNLWGLLMVIRLFLTKGSLGTQSNQRSFWQSGVLAQVLDIAFHRSMEMTIRAEVGSSFYSVITACANRRSAGFIDHCGPHSG